MSGDVWVIESQDNKFWWSKNYEKSVIFITGELWAHTHKENFTKWSKEHGY